MCTQRTEQNYVLWSMCCCKCSSSSSMNTSVGGLVYRRYCCCCCFAALLFYCLMFPLLVFSIRLQPLLFVTLLHAVFCLSFCSSFIRSSPFILSVSISISFVFSALNRSFYSSVSDLVSCLPEQWLATTVNNVRISSVHTNTHTITFDIYTCNAHTMLMLSVWYCARVLFSLQSSNIYGCIYILGHCCVGWFWFFSSFCVLFFLHRTEYLNREFTVHIHISTDRTHSAQY